VQFYWGNNYDLYQFGNEMTGSCRTAVRDKIDLRKGKVVEYKNVRIYDENDRTKFTIIVDNVVEKEVEIYEA
jgi:hypothetical protein